MLEISFRDRNDTPLATFGWRAGEKLSKVPIESRSARILADGDEFTGLLAWLRAGAPFPAPASAGYPSDTDNRNLALITWIEKKAPETVRTWRFHFDHEKELGMAAVRSAAHGLLAELKTCLSENESSKNLVRLETQISVLEHALRESI